MSLIQQALEKTNRTQETQTTTPVPAAKPWDRDPMGAKLEQDLIRIQQEYARRRRLYWKIALGVLFVCFSVGLIYVAGIRKVQPSIKAPPAAVAVSVPIAISAPPEVPAVTQAPLNIYTGSIFRLTGIMDLGDKAMAVINGRIVMAGDSVSDKAFVKAIGKGEVLLDVQGQEIRLIL